jgi:hypothetical protein
MNQKKRKKFISLQSTGRQQKPVITSLRLRKLRRSLIVVFKISIVGKIQLSAVYLSVFAIYISLKVVYTVIYDSLCSMECVFRKTELVNYT